jgi:hypothetical protein
MVDISNNAITLDAMPTLKELIHSEVPIKHLIMKRVGLGLKGMRFGGEVVCLVYLGGVLCLVSWVCFWCAQEECCVGCLVMYLIYSFLLLLLLLLLFFRNTRCEGVGSCAGNQQVPGHY